jgi:hypothetical protein
VKLKVCVSLVDRRSRGSIVGLGLTLETLGGPRGL